MRYFILFRNTEYANLVALELNGIVRNSPVQIMGITPQMNDIYLIDAHFDGLMSELNGLNLVKNLLKDQYQYGFKIRIFSWLSIKQISKLYPEKSSVLLSPNIQFYRFPIIFTKKLEHD